MPSKNVPVSCWLRDKQYLVESRLLPVVSAGFANLGDLVRALMLGNADALMTAVVEAMMTHELFFFRDKIPFDHFKQTVMPALIEARRTCEPSVSGAPPHPPARWILLRQCA